MTPPSLGRVYIALPWSPKFVKQCIVDLSMSELSGFADDGLPLPPGPKGYPIIGNLFDVPVHKSWLAYDEWRKTYGKLL